MAKRRTNQLDDMSLRRWVAAGAPVAKSDGGGLTFTLSRAGTASWVLRYMRDGKAKELTIGNYPDITLAAARKLASSKRVDIDGGADPAAVKRTERIRSKMAWLVRALAVDFEAKHLIPGSRASGTIYYRKWDIEEIILPRLGSSEVRAVTPADIVDMLEKSGRTWSMQRRILITTKLLFDHAIGQRLILTNPCFGIQLSALLGKKPPVRKRVMLSEIELRALLANIEAIGVENSLAFRIMLATCVRTIELVKAKWSDIDVDAQTWFVPDESVKTRVGFLVPLTPTVAKWFERLRGLADGSEWVLPARVAKRKGRPVGTTTLLAAIHRAFDRGDISVQRFTPHDTRSTAKGHMRNLGVSSAISEIALNHTIKGIEGIYDVREEIPERRDALELWAAFVDACERGEKWNVVPIRPGIRVA